jgi:hypothetical protein
MKSVRGLVLSELGHLVNEIRTTRERRSQLTPSPFGNKVPSIRVALGESMSFREELPAGCPPASAHEGECSAAYRFVSSATPDAQAFASHAALQKTRPPMIDSCRWASCSMYTDMDTIQKKRKFKNLKQYTHIALLKIGAGSGKLIEEGSHIDFWMFDTFNPIGAIVSVKDL